MLNCLRFTANFVERPWQILTLINGCVCVEVSFPAGGKIIAQRVKKVEAFALSLSLFVVLVVVWHFN